jgi:hypothetical protein
MKALPLPSLKVLLSLRFNRYYGQLRLPYRPSEISSPYIHSLPSCIASARASRAIPHDLPCVSPLLPREFICRFWQFSSGQMSQPSPNVHRVGNSILLITRLRIGSLALQPAGLLNPPNGPLLRNLEFWVTPHTSFKLHGRTAEFPWSDFDRQVMRRTRHTDIHKIKNFVKFNNPVPDQSFHGQGGCPMSIMLTCIILFVIFRKRKLSEDKFFFQGSRLDKIVF